MKDVKKVYHTAIEMYVFALDMSVQTNLRINFDTELIFR